MSWFKFQDNAMEESTAWQQVNKISYNERNNLIIYLYCCYIYKPMQQCLLGTQGLAPIQPKSSWACGYRSLYACLMVLSATPVAADTSRIDLPAPVLRCMAM